MAFRHRFRLSAAIAATLLSTAAINPAVAETVLNFSGSGEGVGQLDPHVSTKSQDVVLFGLIFNGLVRFAPGSSNPQDIEPDLAEKWEVSSDGRTWLFHLRQGVQFHHGYGEMTADDVVFSLRRATNPKISAFAGNYEAFEQIEAVDPRTVRIKLAYPIPSILGLVTNYQGGNIISKAAVEKMGDGFAAQPVGTGPFAFAEHKTKQYVRLIANEQYFRGRPKIDVLNYLYVPSASSRELAFSKGELQLIVGERQERWVERIAGQKGVAVDVFEPGELRTLHLNTKVAPLDNLKVRQAIAHAIDRDELLAFVGKRVARTSVSPVPQGNLGYTDNLPRYDYDVAKAKKLLAEAGYPNGFSMNVIITQTPPLLEPMQIIQEQLKRAGIALNLTIVEHTAFHAQIRQNLSPMVLYGAARFPVADFYLTPFYHSRSAIGTPTAATNFSQCDVADAEIEAARTASGEQQRTLWATAQKKIMDNVCVVPLFELLQVWVRRDKFDYSFELKGSMSLGPTITEKATLR